MFGSRPVRPEGVGDERPKRQRVREFATLIVAFGLAYLVGHTLLEAVGAPPLLVQLVVFLVFYVAAYVGIWRLSSLFWPDPYAEKG